MAASGTSSATPTGIAHGQKRRSRLRPTIRPGPSCRRTSIRPRTSSSSSPRASWRWSSTARGNPHGYYNTSDAPTRCLFWVTPAGRLKELFDQLHEMTDTEQVVRVSAEHDVEFLPPDEG